MKRWRKGRPSTSPSGVKELTGSHRTAGGWRSSYDTVARFHRRMEQAWPAGCWKLDSSMLYQDLQLRQKA
eukprot:2543519-Amphidinium_carterae.1